MFDEGEIPAIALGIIVAVLFTFIAASPSPSGLYSEHRNYTDTLQRAEDDKR
jgi:hypothetical protein